MGAILDWDMSGQSMGTTPLKKVKRCLNFLYRKADFLDSKCRKMICQALLQSHFDYSCNVWVRSLDKRLQNRLQHTQNEIIRYILKYDITLNNLNSLNWTSLMFHEELITSLFFQLTKIVVYHLDFWKVKNED